MVLDFKKQIFTIIIFILVELQKELESLLDYGAKVH